MIHYPVFFRTMVSSLVFLSVGLFVGSKLSHPAGPPPEHKHNPSLTDYREKTSNYEFIQPLIESEYFSSQESLIYYPYEKEMKESIEQRLNKDSDITTAVYFKDLRNLSWIGLNETEKYNLGSLVKMPLLIAYYKLAENDPGLFEEKITLNGDDQNEIRSIQASTTIQIGQTYTIGELLKALILYSDNNASSALYRFRKDAIKNIFADLKVPLPPDPEVAQFADYITPHEYSLFLSALYNSTYLTRKSSEAVLKLLSEVQYKEGLVEGLPTNTKIAHKFGERGIRDNGKLISYELHDCGVVYLPKNPYILCVMTKVAGPNISQAPVDRQEKIIRDVSAIVYKKVSEQNDFQP